MSAVIVLRRARTQAARPGAAVAGAARHSAGPTGTDRRLGATETARAGFVERASRAASPPDDCQWPFTAAQAVQLDLTERRSESSGWSSRARRRLAGAARAALARTPSRRACQRVRVHKEYDGQGPGREPETRKGGPKRGGRRVFTQALTQARESEVAGAGPTHGMYLTLVPGHHPDGPGASLSQAELSFGPSLRVLAGPGCRTRTMCFKLSLHSRVGREQTRTLCQGHCTGRERKPLDEDG
jgi:hypothetical protein